MNRETARIQLINIDLKYLPDVVKNLSGLVEINEEKKSKCSTLKVKLIQL